MYSTTDRKITWGKGRILDFSQAPLVMGIINVTPDSFYPGSRKERTETAMRTASEMEAAGAHILDIGGESSRPGSDYVGEEEEIRRVVPVIEKIRRESAIVLSVDTRKALVAREALDAGADMINDISALRDDPGLAELAAERSVPVVLMHMRGTPKNMQKNPYYDDVIGELCDELREAVDRARKAGIAEEKIILDPGIGFGKRYSDNLDIIRGIPDIKQLGFPLLIGLSRKSFLGKIVAEQGLDRPVEDRLAASLAANVYCAVSGAEMLRVHDVRETVDAVRVLRAISPR